MKILLIFLVKFTKVLLKDAFTCTTPLRAARLAPFFEAAAGTAAGAAAAFSSGPVGGLDVCSVTSFYLSLGGPSGGPIDRYFLSSFFRPLPTVFRGPFRVRELVLVRWPLTGRPLRCLIPR